MIELTANFSKYEKGKAYIARITGLDRKFGLAREFLAARKTTSRSGATGCYTARVDDGIYEISHTGKRGAERAYVRVEGDSKTRLTIEQVEDSFK